MNARDTGVSYNEEYAVYFEGELVGEADLVYRFAYAWTLNKDLSFQCVQAVYKRLAGQLPSIVDMSPVETRKKLFEESLKALSELEKGSEASQGAVADFLGEFSKNERACLVMIELGGIFPPECARILGVEESDVRGALAKTRRKLVQSFK